MQKIKAQGPEDARIRIVCYGDYECPFARRAHAIWDELKREFGEDEVRFEFRHFPLDDIHPDAMEAAEAAEAAAAQGKFWEMHDLLFRTQSQLSVTNLRRFARQLGLDVEKFSRELEDGVHAESVRKDIERAESCGVDSTPTFFINGLRYDGPTDYDSLLQAVQRACECPTTDDQDYDEQSAA